MFYIFLALFIISNKKKIRISAKFLIDTWKVWYIFTINPLTLEWSEIHRNWNTWNQHAQWTTWKTFVQTLFVAKRLTVSFLNTERDYRTQEENRFFVPFSNGWERDVSFRWFRAGHRKCRRDTISRIFLHRSRRFSTNSRADSRVIILSGRSRGTRGHKLRCTFKRNNRFALSFSNKYRMIYLWFNKT